ncbi:MAG TPA: T9SS type A sorting domain-containing protein, partial [Candidatus Kapabacteria bacterium]|nr:T9SS type A sorting domain-containing protein [Candidatus Kapabacteria bacterium]
NQYFSFVGLDTIGRLNDTILHAVAIGESNTERLALNRDKILRDTTPQAYFPGTKVVTGDINGDGIKDYVVANESTQTITVFFGTDTIGKFDTAMVLHGNHYRQELASVSICVGKFDSGSFDGIIISDRGYSTDGAITEIGRILYYHGGTKLDSASADVITGKSKYDYVGGLLTLGHIRNATTEYLAELRMPYSTLGIDSTSRIFLYQLGPNFNIQTPTDTVILNGDTNQANLMGNYMIADADGDGIDDILLGSYTEVLIYKGGDTISPHITYRFHAPPNVQVASFAKRITDVGDITGRGYHTLVVSYPTDSNTGYLNGAVYLYNFNVGGNAPRDVCTADGFGPFGFEEAFGTQVIASGNVNTMGQSCFMVGMDDIPARSPIHLGALTAFWGDTSYGPVSVREIESVPIVFALSQNYPNPFSGETSINFSVLEPRLYGSSVTITLYNEFGEKIETLYHGAADDIRRSLHFNAGELPSGNYFYRLTCGGRAETKMLTLIH